MSYSDYIKQKIINVYLMKQKIGVTNFNINAFKILEKYDFTPNVNNTITDLSYNNFNSLIKEISSSPLLINSLGIDFLSDLKTIKLQGLPNFFKHTSLSYEKIEDEHKYNIEREYKEIAKMYGLKEFSYCYDSELSSNDNYTKAIILLHKTKTYLKNIEEKFNFTEPYKIGNNILSVQVNWQTNSSDEAYYNFCNNTLCLRDDKSTFPLIHEYVHFVDKTTAALLLTGETTKTLYETKTFSQEELFHYFDMSIFSKLDYDKNPFNWITTFQFKRTFNNEIKQNQKIQNIFKQYDSNYNYKEEFKDILVQWINEKELPYTNDLINKINYVLDNHLKSLDAETKYNEEENRVLTACLYYNSFNEKNNNVINWSIFLDHRIEKLYYNSQKEMLARVIEQVIAGNSGNLSDRLTTPNLLNNNRKEIFDIIKSWQEISHSIINITLSTEVSNRIQRIQKNFSQQNNVIKKLSK